MRARAGHRRRAFTLIEAAVSLAALAVMAAVAIPTYTHLRETARAEAVVYEVQAYLNDVSTLVTLERQVDPSASLATCASCWAQASARLDDDSALINGIPVGSLSTEELILTDPVLISVAADSLPVLVHASLVTAQANLVIDEADPTVTITWPTLGEVLDPQFPVSVQASDDQGVVRVEIWINDRLVGSAAGPVSQVAVDLSGIPSGEALLQARAVDGAGRTGQSAPLSILVP